MVSRFYNVPFRADDRQVGTLPDFRRVKPWNVLQKWRRKLDCSPQGLKPIIIAGLFGTTEVVP
jgi:hypothetical protein